MLNTIDIIYVKKDGKWTNFGQGNQDNLTITISYMMPEYSMKYSYEQIKEYILDAYIVPDRYWTCLGIEFMRISVSKMMLFAETLSKDISFEDWLNSDPYGENSELHPCWPRNNY